MTAALRAFVGLLGASDGGPPGQQQWTVPGTYNFVVPAGVFRISGVAVGPGTEAVGGGLHWRNRIPVTPGETLTIVVAASNRLPGPGVNVTETAVKRGATFLLRVVQSAPYYGTLGGGGGFGGSGAYLSASAGAGGAGGYTGPGGKGGNPGQPPPDQSGGGTGGNPNGDGNGVGLQGRTPDKAPGSLGLPKCGGGIGEGQNGGDGGVRFMWGGARRSYPDAAADA